MPGPKPPEIILSDVERQTLQKLVRRHTTEQRKALRGRIVLLAAEGKNTPEIARELKISLDTVRLWRRRWLDLQPIALADLSVADRLEDLPRPGTPPRLTADQICQAINSLRDPRFRQRLGDAGRRAAERDYNWAAAEQQLAQLYAQVVQRKDR